MARWFMSQKLLAPLGSSLPQSRKSPLIKSSSLMTKVNHFKSFKIYLTALPSVFLGHKIPAFRHAINTRDKIAAKANALAQPPYLVFDYDRRDNCEAFANLLIGAADLHSDGVHGVLGYNVHPCVAAVCCLVDCFRGCKQRMSLREVVQRRLNECCI